MAVNGRVGGNEIGRSPKNFWDFRGGVTEEERERGTIALSRGVGYLLFHSTSFMMTFRSATLRAWAFIISISSL